MRIVGLTVVGLFLTLAVAVILTHYRWKSKTTELLRAMAQEKVIASGGPSGLLARPNNRCAIPTKWRG